MAPRKNKIDRNPAAEAVAKAIIENYKPKNCRGHAVCHKGRIWSHV